MPDILVSVDIEADGPIPADYSMVKLGACVVDEPDRAFMRYLRPMTDQWDAKVLRRIKLEREFLFRKGEDPLKTMTEFEIWLKGLSKEGRRVFVAFNATFDWMFVHWYFQHFLHRDPFGISGKDIKAYYEGALGLENWSDTRKDNILSVFKPDIPHTHDALADAREQAKLFVNIRDFNQHPALVAARKVALADFTAERERQRVGERLAVSDEEGLVVVSSPMSGVVREVFCEVGDIVGKDTLVVNIEAMKMNNEIQTSVSGTIVEVFVAELKRVNQGDRLFSIRT